MGKYDEDARTLLTALGGPSNIGSVTHCATRLRFVLNDASKAEVEQIEALPAVKGTFTNAGQFQVIIGNAVASFYNAFMAVSGLTDQQAKPTEQPARNENKNILQKIVGVLADIFGPIIPAIIVGGLILGVRNVLEQVSFGFLGGQTIVASSKFWAGVNDFLWLPGEAIFHFLPVGITWSIAKRMGTTQILGIVLGITLVSPQLLNAYLVNSTAASKVPFWDFGFAQVNMIGYQAQVIPAIMAGFVLAYLEIFWRKYIPEAVSMIFVPFLSLVPAILVAHTILGPLGWQVGNVISSIVNAGLTSQFNWLFGAVFGLFYAPLVITGLHHTTLAIDAQLVADFGSTNLWPMIALANIAQGTAVMAVIYLWRHDAKVKQVAIPSAISAYLGVTEPAMFGINLKYMYPFVAAMIGSASAGLVVTLLRVRASSIGIGGLPGILAILPAGWGGFALGILVAMAVTFAMTLLFNKLGVFSNEKAPVKTSNEASAVVYAPISGAMRPITEAKDNVFASKAMGEGVVIEPTEGKVFAPAAGEVVILFPTKHAVGLKLDNGAELLIHIGMDTVELNGDGFVVHVQQGDRVEKGQLLVEVDLVKLKNKGYLTETPIVITNSDRHNLKWLKKLKSTIISGEELLICHTKLGTAEGQS
ncbi:MAG: PTS system trehalose-specific EIIBC component [Lactobacillaceae bacterium]|nr:PTS system trehalose-specific EIIBC component [Lactobacillaceae bacterium]